MTVPSRRLAKRMRSHPETEYQQQEVKRVPQVVKEHSADPSRRRGLPDQGPRMGRITRPSEADVNLFP